MSERLTQRTKLGTAVFNNVDIGDIAKKLCDLEDKIEQGKTVELPCKIGQTIYYPSFNVGMVFEYKVVSIKLNSKGLYVVIDNRLRNEQFTHRATQIGKTLFLDRAYAEAKLREMNGENDEQR